MRKILSIALALGLLVIAAPVTLAATYPPGPATTPIPVVGLNQAPAASANCAWYQSSYSGVQQHHVYWTGDGSNGYVNSDVTAFDDCNGNKYYRTSTWSSTFTGGLKPKLKGTLYLRTWLNGAFYHTYTATFSNTINFWFYSPTISGYHFPYGDQADNYGSLVYGYDAAFSPANATQYANV